MRDIDYGILPEHMRDGARHYVENHFEPGGFLQAVFENNLVRAFSLADEINEKAMRQWARFLHNEAPRRCWGSREAVQNWLEERE